MNVRVRNLDGVLAARPFVLGISLLNVLLLSTMGWLLSTRNVATEVDRAAVLAEFRASTSPEAAEASTASDSGDSDAGEPTTSASPVAGPSLASPSLAPTTTAPAATTPAATASAPSSAGGPTPTPAPEPDTTPAPSPAEPSPGPEPAPPDPQPTTSTPEPEPAPPIGYTTPDAGVYTYATTGYESVSILGGRHDYPAETFASVTPTGGCGWHMELQVLREHVDTWDMCGAAGHFSRTGHSRTIEFFGQATRASYDCGEPVVHDEPGIVTGHTRTWTQCQDGPDDSADIDVTLLEHDTLEVAGAPVPAIAVEVVMHFSGGTHGVARDHYWLAADTGLILRLDRTVESTSRTPMGSADYREQATFVLTSLTPAT